jgi:hypothetical protein
VKLCDGKTISVKFANVQAMPTSGMGRSVLKIEPVTEGDFWNTESLAKAISDISVTFPLSTEVAEKRMLMRDFKFKNPQLLKGYSKFSEYTDLVIYFDHGNKDSPVNHAATKAFKCYGLGGTQYGNPWTDIRGACIVLREEPPKSRDRRSGVITQASFEFRPHIPISEMVETLQFFCDRDARHIATVRDSHRTRSSHMASLGSGGMNVSMGGMYYGTGMRTEKKMAKDETQKCVSCGTARALMGVLQACQCREVLYCDKKCQTHDWPQHKHVCKWFLQKRNKDSSSTS